MRILFSSAILVPANYSAFDDKVLGIKIKPGSVYDSQRLDFKWKVSGFTTGKMEIQLDFDDPLAISSHSVSINMQIFFSQIRVIS